MDFLTFAGEHPFLLFACLFLLCVTLESIVGMALRRTGSAFVSKEDEED